MLSLSAPPVPRGVRRFSEVALDDEFEELLAPTNNLVFPQGEEKLEELLGEGLELPAQQRSSRAKSEFEKFAAKSLKSRRSRKILRFPALRRVYAKRHLSADGVVLKAGKSYGTDIHHYLVAWGFRIRNDLHAAGMPSPMPEQLEELFLNTVFAKAQTWTPEDGRGPGLRDSIAEATVMHAVKVVVADWDPDVIEDARVRGKRGGRPEGTLKFTPDMLMGLDEQSIAAQAEALGCSTATISNLRRLAQVD
jgi:hypothetical protein